MKTRKNVLINLMTFWCMFFGKVDKARTNRGPIDYHKSSSSRKHYIPELNIYCGRAFQYGNRKLARNIAIFSLLELITCLNCSDCAGTCYAKKASRQYATAYLHRLFYSYLACNNLSLLKAFIMEDMQHLPKYVNCIRVHEAGDYVSQDYVNMWTEIAAARPDITFYFYTKTGAIFDFSGLLALDNVSMIDSVLPCGRKNYGDKKYIEDMKKEYPGAFICGYGLENAPRCGIDCTYCMTASHKKKIVLFRDHSGINQDKPKKTRKRETRPAGNNAHARAVAYLKSLIA